MTKRNKIKLLKKLYDPNLGMHFYNEYGCEVIKMIDGTHFHCDHCRTIYDSGINWENIADFNDGAKKVAITLQETDYVGIAYIGKCPTCGFETVYISGMLLYP